MHRTAWTSDILPGWLLRALLLALLVGLAVGIGAGVVALTA